MGQRRAQTLSIGWRPLQRFAIAAVGAAFDIRWPDRQPFNIVAHILERSMAIRFQPPSPIDGTLA
ncbi:MAG TPA: hypothetical protein PLS67_07240 [Accumulibacter sp.]|jgi:hypothetical protein|nr:hypothetical protein [Accumulibacter sp.]HQC80301.1 hypothetical protein [Accumulibacter sp.]